MTHAYIYYRIDPAQVTVAAGRIDTLLARMAEYCARPPRRLQRCNDPALWMEVYEDIADYATFAAALDAALRRVDCGTFILGERHLECFSPPSGNEMSSSAIPRS